MRRVAKVRKGGRFFDLPPLYHGVFLQSLLKKAAPPDSKIVKNTKIDKNQEMLLKNKDSCSIIIKIKYCNHNVSNIKEKTAMAFFYEELPTPLTNICLYPGTRLRNVSPPTFL